LIDRFKEVTVRHFERVATSIFVGLAILIPTTSTAFESSDPATLHDEVSLPPASSPLTNSYQRVLIDPLDVEYTAKFLSDDDRRDYRIEGKDLERIRRHYVEVVTAKLMAEYPIASKPGPGVLRIDSVLLDPVLDKRDWLVPTRFVVRGAPRVELIALLRDSRTNEVVDFVGLVIRPHANRLMKDSPGFYWHFMRRIFDQIATRVRWSLEDGTNTTDPRAAMPDLMLGSLHSGTNE
jgi:hypothetical protein